MFKLWIISVILLVVASSLRLEINHDQIQWTTISEGQQLTSSQKSWDDWFRKALPALGDSKLKQISVADNFGAAKYLDTTGTDNQQVAWELEASGSGDKRKMEKVVQVKSTPNKDDPNVSTITTTTFNRKNIIEATK